MQSAAEAVAGQCGMRFFVAPPINGWITLFPSNHGHDQRPVLALAAALPSLDIVHVVLHDSGVFVYGYYRNGQLIDEFNSAPDYFDQASPEEHERQRGRPELFADLPEVDVAKLRNALRATGDDAQVQFERFARLLNLPNAASAFEYLAEGETDGIARFKEFREIPDLAAARRKRRGIITAMKKAARSEGRLLAERIGNMDRHFVPWPVVCPAGGAAFLLAWTFFKGPWMLLRLEPPYANDVTLPEVRPEECPDLPAIVAAGRPGLALRSKGTWQCATLNMDDRIRIAFHAHASCSHSVLSIVSSDPFFAVRTEDELLILHLRDGTLQRRRLKSPAIGRLFTLHPTMRYAVLDGEHGQPFVVDLEADVPSKRLMLGGKCDTYASLCRQLMQQIAITSDASQREALRRQLDELLKLPLPGPASSVQGAETLNAVAFSDDGEWLLTATSVGARAYCWQSVLGPVDGDAMPEPLYAVDAQPVAVEFMPGSNIAQAFTTAVAYDRLSHSMLFGGLEGTVRSVDLRTGQERMLIEVPGRPVISAIDISADGTVICLRLSPDRSSRSRNAPWHVQLWRNPALADER